MIELDVVDSMLPQVNFKCKSGCTECCGAIPVLPSELAALQEVVRNMPKSERKRLTRQTRAYNECPFVDKENNCCSIYEHRPLVCRAFGYYVHLKCSYNPHHAKRSIADLLQIQEVAGHWDELIANNGRPAGLMGVDFNWHKGLIK